MFSRNIRKQGITREKQKKENIKNMYNYFRMLVTLMSSEGANQIFLLLTKNLPSLR